MLESHLQCETGHEVRKLQTEMRELRERENIRHNEIEQRDQARQNHSEERAQALEERLQGLQNHFEERVNVLTDKLKADLNTTRMALFFFSAVFIVIIAGLLGRRLETKLEKSLAVKMGDLEERVSNACKEIN